MKNLKARNIRKRKYRIYEVNGKIKTSKLEVEAERKQQRAGSKLRRAVMEMVAETLWVFVCVCFALTAMLQE